MAEAMESAICSEAKRSYSWWLDSHITPKNSKWLLENLTNMDNKIKSMIRLIEEDADSFARRAEMYYKKRPELMKLVEEFYLAYRALAERYDRVTGALHQAHRTIAVAFPNQVQLILPDEPPSGLPDSVEEKQNFPIHSYSDGNGEYTDKNNPFMIKEERKPLNRQLADEKGHNIFAEELLIQDLHSKEDDGENSEIKKLQEEVSKLSIENKNLKNQISSESMRADEAETESQGFKDVISKLKFQLEAAFVQHKASQERMSYLEAEISQRRDEAHHLNDEMSIKVTKLNTAEERCIDIEKENSSLRFELSKFNEASARQVQEVSDLLKENLNHLHNTVKLELLRAERAETESCSSREVISKLSSELGTSLLRYKVSLERISDLEAEIRRTEDEFQNLNGELSIRTSKLNIAEEQYLVLLEENKSLQSTVDRFKMLMANKEVEVILKEEELCKLKQFIKDERQRFKYAGIQESMSLQTELNKFKQRVGGQEEELDVMVKELDKLKRSLEDERQLRMIAEVANQSLKKLFSQSEEKVRVLSLEIQSRDEILRRMEHIKIGLEEEIKRLHDENNSLSEKSFSSLSKIVGLQDEINSLKRSKLKISDELSFHLDQNKGLQQELFLLKTERNNSEERHRELMERLVEVNFSVVSFRTLVQQLLDGKTELKDAHKKHEYPFNLEDLRLFESLSERNSLLENSLSNLTVKLEWLREKIKELEECCESLRGNAASHASENNVMDFHAEAVAKNMRILSEKTTLFENSLSDAIFEFEDLREKVKALEGTYNSLYYQNCYLIAENNNLVAQVEKIEQHMESLENRFSTFEVKHLNLDNEKDLALYQVEEIKGLLKSAKEDHENHALFFNSQTSALINQINILKEKNQLINEELDDGQHETVKSGIDCFIMKQILYDMNEKNLILSDEYRKCMNKLRCAEEVTLELKRVQSTQEKKLVLLLEENKKFLEWVQALLKVFEAEEDNETSNGCYKNMVQFISHKMRDLQASVSDPEEEFYHIYLEKSPFVILLEQLGLGLVELRAQKYVVEQESEKKNEEILLLRSRSYELMEINEQLRKDLNACNQQKEDLMIELEAMHLKLSDLQEAQSTFHGEIPKSFAESECISSKSFELREQTVSQEEEHEAILEEFMIHENLSYNFRSSDAEKFSGIDQLINDVYNLHGITNELGQDVRVLNESMRALQSENMHLSDLFVDFEARNSALFDDDVDRVSEVFELRTMEWSDKHKRFQNMQLENTKLCVNLEGLMMELNKANVVREELEKKILHLSKEIVHKDDKNESLRHSNEKFVGEISRLHQETAALKRREKNLTSELQAAKNKIRCSEEESAAYLLDINVASINELVFKQKVVELMLKIKNLEASGCVQSDIPLDEISPSNVQREDLMKQVDVLVKENKELEAYFPHLRLLDNDIGSLEEHTISLANDHILCSEKEQGNNSSATLQRKRLSQVRGDDHASEVSAGIMELKKLHAKVKKLQKTVINAEKLLAQEEIVTEATTLASATRKIKTRRSKVNKSPLHLETEKKKDIILDSRKSSAAEKDVRLLKIDQHMLKDIELDHVLSSFRSGDDFSSETDEQNRDMLEPVIYNSREHHKIDIMAGERSTNPSSELVLEKEFSVGELELLASKLEWSRRVSETLSSDALRLCVLQENLEELKKNMEASEMSIQSSSASKSITEQLKMSAVVIEQLIDINFKLTEMADNFSASLDDKEGRTRVSERVQIASEKIDVVELELENTHCIFSRLLEEQEGKAPKTLQRKSRFPLKGFMYWKRNYSRQNRRRFCACMRFNTISD